MQGGFFGKIPAKADFVSGHCPAGFLTVWEPFLMKGLARSRLDLKDAWEEAYMTMPVWRFLLKPEEGGNPLPAPVAGAFMPSVDRVGREFPLTLVVPLEGDSAENGPGENWYQGLEAVLLKMLEDDSSLAGLKTAVSDLPTPGTADVADRPSGYRQLEAMEENASRLTSSFWCRGGGNEFSFRCDGLPNEAMFARLLLPENDWAEGQELTAGETTGQHHPEDHRT